MVAAACADSDYESDEEPDEGFDEFYESEEEDNILDEQECLAIVKVYSEISNLVPHQSTQTG